MKKYLHWFGKAVRPYWGAVTVMMTCHVLLAACSVCFVFISKRLVDTAVAVFSGSAAESSLVFWLSLMVAVVLMRILLNSCRTYLQTKTEIRLKNSMRRHLFGILLRVSDDGGKRHHTGDILNRVQEDVRVVSSVVASSIPNLFGTALQFVAALAFLLYLDLRLAAAIVVIVPVGIVVGRFISGKIRNLTLDIRNKDSKVQAHLQESIQHLTLLQTLEYEDASADELNDLQGGLYASEIRRTKFSVVSRIFIALAFQAGYVMAFMWGVFGISRGTVTYGMMTAFLQLVGQIQRPLLEMSSQIPSIIHSTASIDRIMELEALPYENDSESVLVDGVAGIALEDVSFSYPDSGTPVLDRFSHDFKPGSRTAIVGPTGVGKTTLIRLLLALLKPQSGDIYIYAAPAQNDAMGQHVEGEDSVLQASGAYPYAPAPRAAGQNQRYIVSPATRCNLIYVPQGNSLFSGSVRDNLLMGNPDASELLMKEALHIAAADFVLEHPDGLDMLCFESGGGLSEGQAQRIAIARALLRPGTILLLDEFSSALDAETETVLMERLTADLPEHTMIFITHREKIIDYCTDVLRLV